MLNELTAADRAALVDAAAGAARAVLIVEAGTPAGYARVIEARDRLIAAGFRVAAPCPHSAACPIVPGTDWCHFAARVSRSSLHRQVKSGSLAYEDEKFSYVAATRLPPNPPPPGWSGVRRSARARCCWTCVNPTSSCAVVRSPSGTATCTRPPATRPGATPGRPGRTEEEVERDVRRALRIVIAEDDPLLREGLALLLRAEGMDVVATADTAESVLAAIDEHEPDVAILDVRMPPTHTDEGVRAAVEARRRRPGLAVLVLSAYVEQSFATDLLTGGVGGLGYLLKERVGRVEEFMGALGRVVGGGTAIDPEVVAQLFTRTRQDTRMERLSPREQEVLGLMAEGLGNSAIAGRLVVTDGAVHKHIRSIFAKLDLSPADQVDRRVAAVLHYLENARAPRH